MARNPGIEPAPLVLASASPARRDVLAGAGVDFSVDVSTIDEGEFKKRLTDPPALARALADAKAGDVAARHPGVSVIGADQVLVCDGELFDKPVDRAAAAGHLRRLRGRQHTLISALSVVRDGQVRWRHGAEAMLWMRPFSDAFLEQYLDLAGDDVLASVGAYRLEGAGAQLFERIEGDFFTILGLPLLPLLAYLRGQRLIDS